jgi:predicted lysophospholipase L1 biosynthesis ABC-type transport system permease subunit
MRLVGLIFRELGFRWANGLLAVAALAAAVAICVALAMSHAAAERETRRLTRDIGFNLRIIPRDADETDFLLQGYADATMPTDVVDQLAANKTIAYNHLVATLKQKIDIDGKTAILTGLGDTRFPPGGKKKQPMSQHIEPGTAHLGNRIAEQLGLPADGLLTIGEVSLQIERVAPPAGTQDDIAIVVNLADAQKILGMADQINEIQAIDCLCLAASENPQEILRREVERVAPEAKVIMRRKIADARAKLRQNEERFAAFAMPLALAVSAIWVGALAMLNVRQRRDEIGLLKALGYRGPSIAGLFLGRAIVIGLVAALVGYAVGTALGIGVAPKLFQATAKAVRAEPMMLGWSLFAAPLVAALASLLPATIASTQDPAVVLRTE